MVSHINPPTENSIAPILGDAERFLAALGDKHCFQTFDDRAVNRSLARTLHGTLNELAATLTRLNKLGAGIFVTLNEIVPGLPRKAEHVSRVRTLFADADDPLRLAEVEAAIEHIGLPPSIVVETSPGKRHFYLVTNDCPLSRFTEAQKALAAILGTDPAVCDLPRVARVPGFHHMKREPFLVPLVSASPTTYAFADIISKLGLSAAASTKTITTLDSSAIAGQAPSTYKPSRLNAAA